MTTIESVCNQALDLIGYPRHIGHIYDGSKAARVALNVWGETRDALLSTVQPEWARGDTMLALIRQAPVGAYLTPVDWNTSYPPIPWLYEYMLPDECLVPITLKPQPAAIPVWRPKTITFRTNRDINGDYTILANVYPAILTCIKQVLDPNIWQDEFTEAMTQAMAKKMETALGKQPAKKEEKQNANPA